MKALVIKDIPKVIPQKKLKKLKLINRELSWLSFNERVLQEAMDKSVPLLERLKFLAIFSSNMDEFFRVRVASVRRLLRVQRKAKSKDMEATMELLSQIQSIVVKQQDRFNDIYEHHILKQLAKENIFIINEKQLDDEQKKEVKRYFKTEVLSNLFPVILDHLREFPFLKDKSIYLAIKMTRPDRVPRNKYALIEVPTGVISRFFILPKKNDKTHIILLDDVIRNSLDEIFSNLDYEEFEAYTIKMTRDAELDMDNDLSENIQERITKSLMLRKKGIPVRFIYDEEMPTDLLEFLMRKLSLSKQGLIPGGRYHNFKDFMDFPQVGSEKLRNKPMLQLPLAEFEESYEMFPIIKEKDRVLYHPYHSFDYVIRFLREAAIDPQVYAIKITLYRVAKHSNVVNALINAVKNGKQVTAVIELQARFDEESNLYWAGKLQEAGAKVIFGIPGIKIHAKACLIFRRENNRTVHYAHLSTGNYNGKTARLYCDFGIFTADKRITSEVVKLFSFINNFPKINYKFKHLLVSPTYAKPEIIKLIKTEIRNKKKGLPAYIFAKMNSLVDEEVIAQLYEASAEGVKIRLIVRGICCLIPGKEGLSENIEVISIIDKFLEHARVFIFANAGKEKMYLGSPDWMGRNLDRRIEIAFPILNVEVKQKIRDIMEIQWSDSVKARIVEESRLNRYRDKLANNIRSQEEIYNYLSQQNLNFPSSI